MKCSFYSLAVCLVLLSCDQKKNINQWSLTSPSGKTGATIYLSESSGKLIYKTFLVNGGDSTTLTLESPLGLIMSQQNFAENLRFTGLDSALVDEEYTLMSGKQLSNRNYAKELTLKFQNSNAGKMNVVFRAYDDGIAFRYQFSELQVGDTVLQELTGFYLPDNGQAWLQPYDTVTKWSPGYEQYYVDGVNMGTQSPRQGGWCFPALFKLERTFLLLTEANLSGDYFGSHLQNDVSRYRIELPDPKEAFGLGTRGAIVNQTFSTPWRLLIAGNINTVVESNLVNHLSEKQSKHDFSWVKPGRATWGWWSDQDSPKDFNKLKEFVDLAAEMGWEYSLVDANWNEMKNGNLELLAKYAASKNVGLWAWYNSGGPHNEVTEQPRDRMSEKSARQKEFDWLRAIGIKGIKVDFFQSDKQPIIQEYLDILKDAADRNIMVNFHGCTIPRGWSRTWPNLLSMESARGAETYLFGKDFPEKAPLHNVHLAFTRNVIGSMDYTPITFSNGKYPHQTTNGHELALSIVFESGIVHPADAVASYRSLPGDVKDFLKNLPVVWDETKLLAGEPDTDILLARRNKDVWYVGYINGKAEGKDIKLSLSFLPEGNYSLHAIGDTMHDKKFSSLTKSVQSNHIEKISVLPQGGFVCEIRKQ